MSFRTSTPYPQGFQQIIPKRGYANLAAATSYYVTWDCATTWGGTAESAAQVPIPFSGYCKELRVVGSFNSASANMTFTVRKNGVATSMTVTVTAGTVTEYTDSAHPFSFVKGDKITIERLTPGGTGTIDANYTLVYYTGGY